MLEKDQVIRALAELPTKLIPTPIQPLITKRAELLDKSRELGATVVELMHGKTRSDAIAKDNEAAAAAILAGQPTPDNAHLAEVQRDLNGTARDQRAISAALEQLDNQIMPTITGQIDQITVEVEANQAAALKQWRNAVTALLKARDAITDADNAASILAGATDTATRPTIPYEISRGISTYRVSDIHDLLATIANS